MNYSEIINSALKEFSQGKKEQAYKKLKIIFNKNKDDDLLRFNLAVIEQSLGLNNEAKHNYKHLIKINKNYKAMNNLYLLYIKENNYLDALDVINQAIKAKDITDIIIKDKAYVLYNLKRYDDSINICENYLNEKSDVNVCKNLELNYFGKGNFQKSEEVFQKGLKKYKNNPFILNSLGRLYHEKRDSNKAERYLLKAYQLKKDSYEIINNLAGFYREEGKYHKSIDLYLMALKLNNKNPAIINNLAKAYFDIGEFDLAEKYCLRALNLNKHDGNIQKILSLIYLRQHKFKDAWYYFDGRLNLSDFIDKNSSINNIRKKLLAKNYLKKDLKILVLREQGVGDEILYGTMYEDLLENCNDVTIECDKRLKRIFCNSFPSYKNSFIENGAISFNKNLLKKYDVAVYAGSLGKFFRKKIQDFSNKSYLYAERKLIEKTKKKFSSLDGKFNIGISWKSFQNRYSKEKSLILDDFINILSNQKCNYINLQYGDVYEEIKIFNEKYNKNIITFEDLDIFNNFDDLASYLINLDLFISVSNSTAHLAGALGVKTLLIRPENHAVFHYWNQPDNKTPWYSSIRFLSKNEILNDTNLINKYLIS